MYIEVFLNFIERQAYSMLKQIQYHAPSPLGPEAPRYASTSSPTPSLEKVISGKLKQIQYHAPSTLGPKAPRYTSTSSLPRSLEKFNHDQRAACL
jgi:hypothetical protein